jgi:hypothetical protein
MLKMKIDPAMCMKTQHKDKLSRVNKAKRVGFEHESCSITRHHNANRAIFDNDGADVLSDGLKRGANRKKDVKNDDRSGKVYENNGTSD